MRAGEPRWFSKSNFSVRSCDSRDSELACEASEQTQRLESESLENKTSKNHVPSRALVRMRVQGLGSGSGGMVGVGVGV